MRIAVLQAPGPDPGLARTDAAAARAADRNADVLVTPELFAEGYGAPFSDPDPALRLALGSIARRHGIALVTALIEEIDGPGGHRSITAVVLAPDGSELGRYRKTHLWGTERAAFRPGDGTPLVVGIGGLRCGVAVCYDVEFPEVVRGLALAGADVVLVPTALDDPAVAHLLVPARAYENRVALAYADHTGPGFCGASVIVGPDGSELAGAGGPGEALLVADVGAAHLERARARVDYLADRRPETYRLGRATSFGASNAASLAPGPAPTTGPATPSMLVPDFPFPYDTYLAHPAGLGTVPEHVRGTEVAVVGAGLSGLVAAHELRRLGLHPVLYEAGEIGGRLRSASFPGCDPSSGAVADLGAMRFPASGRAFAHYLDLVGARTSPFPNPLAPATPSTVIELGSRAHYAESPDDLPPVFGEVARAWDRALHEGAEIGALRTAIRERDLAAVKAIWNRTVPRLDEETFYGFVARSGAFPTFAHRELFGQVGFGTGGWDTDFPNSALEVLRVVATGADEDHARITGGAQQVPLGLWRLPGPDGVSLETWHGGAARPAVRRLRRLPDGTIGVLDRWGGERRYPAVISTVQSWLLSAGIDTDESLFAHDLWMALERSHYMQSSKTFVLVDRPFWRDRDPRTGRHRFSTTLTDRMTRATYLLDGGAGLDDPAAVDLPAVVCLSYTWNDDALKWLALPTDTRVRLMLHSLRQIHPDLDLARHLLGEPITVSWEREPHFMGAFRGNLPGHYRYQRRLFAHFVQNGMPAAHRGIFLAGDDISFTPGWAEGAVHTALNAVWGVMTQLGGASDPANPGPGDRFAELGPVALDDLPIS